MKKTMVLLLVVLIIIPFNVFINAADSLVNVALNKPVSISATDDFYIQNFPASRLTDGQNSANYDGAIINYVASNGQGWFEIDLQGSFTINSFKLVFQNAEWFYRPRDYAIDVLSGPDWIRVVEQHDINYTELEYILNFAPVECSKIRITGSNVRNSSINFRLVELEAYNNPSVTTTDYTPLQIADNIIYKIDEQASIPVNVALEKPVEISVTDDFYLQNYPASRLTDGENSVNIDGAIINYSAQTKLGWYEIDLLGSFTINRFKLVFQNAEWSYRPKDYAIDVLSGSGWVRVVEQHNVNYTELEYLLNFAPVECSKIRITGSNARNSSLNFRLAELEAYNNPSVTVADYTPLQQADIASYAIPLTVVAPEPTTAILAPKDPSELNLTNIALNKTVTTSKSDDFYIENFPASRLTDGQNSDSIDGAIINYTSETGLGWYEVNLKKTSSINQIKLIFQNAEWSFRPLDYAIDVLSGDSWIRVVEQHNINYDKSVFIFNFASVQADKIRITGSNKRNASLNFRLAELEVYDNPTVTSTFFTVQQSADDKKYSITKLADARDETSPATGDNKVETVLLILCISFLALLFSAVFLKRKIRR